MADYCESHHVILLLGPPAPYHHPPPPPKRAVAFAILLFILLFVFSLVVLRSPCLFSSFLRPLIYAQTRTFRNPNFGTLRIDGQSIDIGKFSILTSFMDPMVLDFANRRNQALPEFKDKARFSGYANPHYPFFPISPERRSAPSPARAPGPAHTPSPARAPGPAHAPAPTSPAPLLLVTLVISLALIGKALLLYMTDDPFGLNQL